MLGGCRWCPLPGCLPCPLRAGGLWAVQCRRVWAVRAVLSEWAARGAGRWSELAGSWQGSAGPRLRWLAAPWMSRDRALAGA